MDCPVVRWRTTAGEPRGAGWLRARWGPSPSHGVRQGPRAVAPPRRRLCADGAGGVGALAGGVRARGIGATHPRGRWGAVAASRWCVGRGVVRWARGRSAAPALGGGRALAAAHTDVVVVLACDVPEIRGTTLRDLIDAAPAVAEAEGRAHPLVAAYPADWADRARHLAAAGASVRSFAEPAARVSAPAVGLANVNDANALGAEGPLERLAARVPFLSAAERPRMLRGECARVLASGMLLPKSPEAP